MIKLKVFLNFSEQRGVLSAIIYNYHIKRFTLFSKSNLKFRENFYFSKDQFGLIVIKVHVDLDYCVLCTCTLCLVLLHNRNFPCTLVLVLVHNRKEQCNSCESILAGPRNNNHLGHEKISGIKQFYWLNFCHRAAN